MAGQPNVHLVSLNSCLLVALVKDFFLIHDVKFVDQFLICTVVQISALQVMLLNLRLGGR